MISTHYKVLAYLHATVGALCLFAALSDLFMERLTSLTPINLFLAAANLWLGMSRLEGK